MGDRTITIICTDLKTLAADSQVTAGCIKSYYRSKIRIIKQHAIATCGDEEDGFNFEKWFFDQQGGPFAASDDDFSAMVLNKESILLGNVRGENHQLSKLQPVREKMAIGATEAAAASEILMKKARLNAHDAAIEGARYHIYCGEPVYSINKKQLIEIPHDFDGYWIGTHQTPLGKLADYLITYKQWLRT